MNAPHKLIGVSKTALLTLRARADEQSRSDRLFEDPRAVEWLAQAEWPSELDGWYSARVGSYLAFRAAEIDQLVAGRIAARPGALTVVELGCGLSSRASRLGAGARRWVDLDLPDVIAMREKLEGAGGANHRHLARSVLDRAWFEEIAHQQDPGELLLIAEGLFYYLPRPEIDRLFLDLRRRFPGAVIIFDLIGQLDYRAIRVNSVVARAPVQWMITPPFEQAWPTLGLEALPGLAPAQLLGASIQRFKRFGLPFYLAVKLGAHLPLLRGLRSGVVIGALRPL